MWRLPELFGAASTFLGKQPASCDTGNQPVTRRVLQNCLMTRAGTPPTTVRAGTSFVTTAPAATIA